MDQAGLASQLLGPVAVQKMFSNSRSKTGPQCAVCGCSLRDARVFHQRYHVCPEHATSDAVMLNGLVQRFCQQCGRFHELERFAPGMRSCRAQLAKHAERRRKRRAAAAAAKARARALGLSMPTTGKGAAAMAAPSREDGNEVSPITVDVLPVTPAAAAPAGGPAPPASKRKRLGVDQGISQPQNLAVEGVEGQMDLPSALQGLLQPEHGNSGAMLAPGHQQVQARGSGKHHDGSSGSVQSTHSTHVAQPAQKALDVLLAAAEEEQQAGQEQPAGGQTAPVKPDPAWFGAAPSTQPTVWELGPQASADPHLPVLDSWPALPLPPMPEPWQQPGSQQPPQAATQPQQWQPPPLPPTQQPQLQWPQPAAAPAQPPSAQPQHELVQLLQHLTSPAAAAAFASLNQQLQPPAQPHPPAAAFPLLPPLPASIAPPPSLHQLQHQAAQVPAPPLPLLQSQPQQQAQAQPSIASVLASIQEATAQVTRQSRDTELLQMVLQLVQQQAPAPPPPAVPQLVQPAAPPPAAPQMVEPQGPPAGASQLLQLLQSLAQQ